MPRIAQLYGIAVYMYFGDHPPPHVHAIYGRFEAEIEITTGGILKGQLPVRARRLVREWTREYRRELEENWGLARSHRPLRSLPPLE